MTKFTKHTKIIFLDMDGVINSQDRNQTIVHRPDLHSPELVSILNRLSEIPDVKIVLSSTWRYEYDTPEKVNEIFKQIGIKLECVGVTPRYGSESCRGIEIEHWIKANIPFDYWIYNRYVIIDDDSDMLYNQRNNFFHVDHAHGITHNHVYKIVNFFKQFD